MSSHFFAPDRFETESFILRSPMPGDGNQLAKSLNPSYQHLRRFLPWAKEIEDPDDCESRVRDFRAKYITNVDYVVFILSRDESTILGGTGFHLRGGSVEGKRGEIGMWVNAEKAGSGLGTQVLVSMLQWGFDAWPFERLCWKCSTENHSSRRVAEKAGMKLDVTERRILGVPGEPDHDQLSFVAFRDE